MFTWMNYNYSFSGILTWLALTFSPTVENLTISIPICWSYRVQDIYYLKTFSKYDITLLTSVQYTGLSNLTIMISVYLKSLLNTKVHSNCMFY